MDTFTTAALNVLGDRYADDYSPTPEEASAILAEERRLTSEARAADVRAEAEAKARAESDPLAEARARAEAIRAEQDERAKLVADARLIWEHDHPELGSPDGHTEDEILSAAGFQKSQAQIDAELATDVQANIEASERPRTKWEPTSPPDSPFIADLKARDGGDS